jgi:hypothetical protein
MMTSYWRKILDGCVRKTIGQSGRQKALRRLMKVIGFDTDNVSLINIITNHCFIRREILIRLYIYTPEI